MNSPSRRDNFRKFNRQIFLEKCGCPPRFTQIIRGLHDGMKLAQVGYGGDVPESFEVSRDVKLGSVLAPVLFNIYVQVITRLLSAVLDR